MRLSELFREPFNGISHLVAAVISLLAGIPLLILGWNGTLRIVSILVYLISLLCLFAASSTYHLVTVKPGILKVFRKLDHSAIYLLIAGTYTPFCINAFTGFFRWGFLAIIWGIAIIGILVKVFYINSPRWLNATFYVLMGWMCILVAKQMALALSIESLAWLIAGGVIYTLGAIIYAARLFNFFPGKFGFHEVWHLFVIGGAFAHLVSVYYLVFNLN